MQLPTIVYRCPGTHQIKGGTYDYLGVKDQGELDAALQAGYSITLPEAIEKKYGPKKPAPAPILEASKPAETEVLGDTTPPTREELEEQATKLGVKFKKNISDEELSKKIDEALEA